MERQKMKRNTRAQWCSLFIILLLSLSFIPAGLADLDSEIAPFVSLSASSTIADVNEPVVFFAIAQAFDGADIMSYNWDFGGDPGFASGSVAVHLFTQTGTFDVSVEVMDTNGNVAYDSTSVTVRKVGQAPFVSLSASSQLVQVDQPVTLIATAYDLDPQGGILGYQWTIDGEGEASTNSVIVKSWDSPGVHDVSVEVTNYEGNQAFDTIQIVVEDDLIAPTVIVTASPPLAVPGQIVSFTAIASSIDGDILSYKWDFDDGESAGNSPAVTHSFDAPGIYQVTVEVLDSTGHIASDSAQVTVEDDNIAPFVQVFSSATNVQPGSTVSFWSTASDPDGDILSYQWDFDDGTTAPNSAVTHTFNQAGVFSVTLTATDSNGDVGSDAVTIFVGQDQASGSPLLISAEAAENVLPANQPFQFFGTVVNRMSREISSFAWDFGDGTRAISDWTPVVHVYGVPGAYFVKLTVTDIYGNTASTMIGVLAVKSTDAGAPISLIKANPMTGEAPLKVSFSGKDSYDPDGTIVSYKWDFGDQILGLGKDVDHNYINGGLYNATLTVTDNDGKTGKSTVTIKVTKGGVVPGTLNAKIGAQPTTGAAPLIVQFSSDGSTGNITSFEWDFGDGEKTTAKNPTHTFKKIGKYVTTLTVRDKSGQSDSEIVTITVAGKGEPNKLPIAVASAFPEQGMPPLTVQFSSAGSTDPDGQIVSYLWDFGDKDKTSSANPEHTYTKVGEYVVTLTVVDNNGAKGVDELVVRVSVDPQDNRAPVITPIRDQIAYVNESFTMNVIANDMDQDPLTYEMAGAPAGLLMNPENGFVSGIPTELGEYVVIVTVTDSEGHVAADAFMLSVVERVAVAEKDNSGQTDVSVARVNFRSGEYVTLADIIPTGVLVRNNNDIDLKDVKVAVSIPELGIRQVSGPFDLDGNDEDLRRVVLQLPDYTPVGDLTLRVVISNDNFHSIRHREITVWDYR